MCMCGGARESKGMLKGVKVCNGGICEVGWSLGFAVAVDALETEPMTMPTFPSCPGSAGTPSLNFQR